MSSTPPQSIKKFINNLRGGKAPWRENLRKLRVGKRKKGEKGDYASNHISAEPAYYNQDIDDPGEGPDTSEPHINGP